MERMSPVMSKFQGKTERRSTKPRTETQDSQQAAYGESCLIGIKKWEKGERYRKGSSVLSMDHGWSILVCWMHQRGWKVDSRRPKSLVR